MGVSTNTAHLLSYVKQNFSVQTAHKSTFLPLTFLGPLSPSVISFLTASLSSQTAYQSSSFFSSTSLLTKPRTQWPRAQEIVFVFVFDCRSSGEVFTVSDITSHYWQRRRVKLSFLWTRWRYRYFKFWKTRREGLTETLTFVVTRISTLYFVFQGGCWIDFNSF